MHILTVIQSVNKVAIAAFLLTGFSLLYEVYLFATHKGEDKKSPKIPELRTIEPANFQRKIIIRTDKKKQALFRKPNHTVVVFLLVLLVIFAFIAVAGNIFKKNTLSLSQNLSPSPSFQTLSSEGIKLYNKSWQQLNKQQLRFSKPGDTIIIGVKNILGVVITKARIRINTEQWTAKNETKQLNEALQVFYIDYTIASADAQLKIDAQLYSQKEGWLGE